MEGEKYISIHAPRTGSDSTVFGFASMYFVFQSTLPARGATYQPALNHQQQRFQSTLPARGATTRSRVLSLGRIFQSTLPARGATKYLSKGSKVAIISIHAPRTGSDGGSLMQDAVHSYFNPRSPHGERRESRLTNLRSRHFNPRSPHGERPCAVQGAAWRHISIHAPRTGSDVQADSLFIWYVIFQSTLPARGATYAYQQRFGEVYSFQSTLPARGATRTSRLDSGK